MGDPDVSDITRVEIAIPYNKNTYPIIRKVRDTLVSIFGGLTYSRMTTPGMFEGAWRGHGGTPAYEDVSLFILYFSPQEIPNWSKVLKAISKMILKSGEKETWLVFQSARRYIYRSSRYTLAKKP